MKLKIVSIGIIISLMLLVLPAASSASDQTLGIFGNANEDGTINMQDVTYTELIILEYKDQTQLADAKYDGEIDILDVTQIELIILGQENELTIIDGNGEVVTVPKPVERIVVLYKDAPEILRALNAADRIVGVSNYIKQDDSVLLPEISKLPGVGGFLASEIDYEAVLSLNPDILLTFVSYDIDKIQEKLPGVTVIFLGLYFPDLLTSEQSRYTDGVKKIGYIVDRVEDAEKFTDWRDDWISKIKSRTEKISDDERPTVYNTRYSGPTWDYRICCADYKTYEMTTIAGGKDIAENLDECGYWSIADPEWLIEQNPDIIVVQAHYECTDHGYNTDDPSEMAAIRDDIVNNPVLANVNAMKNGNIYMMAGNFRNGGDGNIIGTAYMAKWFHPELFEDLDPQVIHQQYLTEFQGLDYDLDERGVFVYPPINE